MNRITEWNHIHKKSPERAKASLNLMLCPFWALGKQPPDLDAAVIPPDIIQESGRQLIGYEIIVFTPP